MILWRTCARWRETPVRDSKPEQSGAYMELLNFFREEPMMVWFAFLALLVTLYRQ